MVDSSWHGSFHIGSPGTYLINILLDILGLDILLSPTTRKVKCYFWEVGKSNLGFSPDFVAKSQAGKEFVKVIDGLIDILRN